MTATTVDQPGTALSRRRVLIGAGTLTAAGALAGPGRGLLDLLRWWDGERATLERSSMNAELGHRLTVRLDDGTAAELRLDSIEELPFTAVSNVEGQFAARFSARGGLDLAQATYALASSRFGEIDLFLSPIHDHGDATDRYEALFNRPADLEEATS